MTTAWKKTMIMRDTIHKMRRELVPKREDTHRNIVKSLRVILYLKGWIKQSSIGDGYAYCSACDVHLKVTAGITDLKRHSENKKHIGNSKAVKGQSSLSSLMVSKTDNGIKEGELKLVGFIAEHDLLMSVADHLPKLMKTVCKDSKIAEKSKMWPS